MASACAWLRPAVARSSTPGGPRAASAWRRPRRPSSDGTPSWCPHLRVDPASSIVRDPADDLAPLIACANEATSIMPSVRVDGFAIEACRSSWRRQRPDDRGWVWPSPEVRATRRGERGSAAFVGRPSGPCAMAGRNRSTWWSWSAHHGRSTPLLTCATSWQR